MASKDVPVVDEMGKILRWFRWMGVGEGIRAEWAPPCSMEKLLESGEVVASFRSASVWRIDVNLLQ